MPAEEAERAGFVTRLVDDGTALDAARRALAAGIAATPWTMRRPRPGVSVYEGLGLELEEGLANEDRHGQEVIFAPGFAEGVARFGANQAERTGDRPDPAVTR